MENQKLLQFTPRRNVCTKLAIHTCLDILLKTTNLNLLVEEMSESPQTYNQPIPSQTASGAKNEIN